MSLPYEKKLIANARALRKRATPQENHLWYDFLRSCPVRFQRQKVIGSFIVAFYCHEAKLAIEIDGSQHYEPRNAAHEVMRTALLQEHGVTVLRFSDHEINVAFDAVCQAILHAIGSLPEGAVSEAD